MKKVGRDVIESGTVRRKVAYRDIKSDADGWVDATKFLPADYDLMSLRIAGDKEYSGWVVGNRWDGLKISRLDKVLYWKRKMEPL